VWKHGSTYSVRRIPIALEVEDLKVKTTEHIDDAVRHITDDERAMWNGKVERRELSDFENHIINSDIHTTPDERNAYESHI